MKATLCVESPKAPAAEAVKVSLQSIEYHVYAEIHCWSYRGSRGFRDLRGFASFSPLESTRPQHILDFSHVASENDWPDTCGTKATPLPKLS